MREEEPESDTIIALRERLLALLQQSLTGRFNQTDLGSVANKEFKIGKLHIADLAKNRIALVYEIVAEAKKREDLKDYKPCEWAHIFSKAVEAEAGYAAACEHMNLRKRFSYSRTIGSVLPIALQILWTGCYCWAELPTVISPDSVKTFSEFCFSVFSLLGDKVLLVPMMKVSSPHHLQTSLVQTLLQTLRTNPSNKPFKHLTQLLLLFQDLVKSLEHRTEAFDNAASEEKIDELLSAGYEDRRSKNGNKDLLLSHPFCFGGVEFPGAIFSASTKNWSQEGMTIQGNKSREGGLLTALNAQLKSAKLPAERSQMFSFHSNSPLWDYLGFTLKAFCAKNPDLTPGVVFAAGETKTEAFVASNEQGRNLIGE